MDDKSSSVLELQQPFRLGFQHLPRGPAYINVLKIMFDPYIEINDSCKRLFYFVHVLWFDDSQTFGQNGRFVKGKAVES